MLSFLQIWLLLLSPVLFMLDIPCWLVNEDHVVCSCASMVKFHDKGQHIGSSHTAKHESWTSWWISSYLIKFMTVKAWKHKFKKQEFKKTKFFTNFFWTAFLSDSFFQPQQGMEGWKWNMGRKNISFGFIGICPLCLSLYFISLSHFLSCCTTGNMSLCSPVF